MALSPPMAGNVLARLAMSVCPPHAPYIAKHSALLLGNHGPVTMGNSAMQAYYRMETLQHVAHVYFITTLLGGPIEFTPEQAKQIFDKIEASGRIHPGNIKL